MTNVDRRRAASIPARTAAAAKSKASRAGARGRVRDFERPPTRTAGSPSRRKPGLPDLDRETAADTAVREILAALAAAAAVHRQTIVDGDVSPRADCDAIHDLRIAVRRARTLLGQLRGVFPRGSTRELRDGLRWLGELSGPVRNVDVLEQAVKEAGSELPAADRQALDQVRALLARQREQGRVTLVEGLQSSRHAHLVEAVTRFAETPAVSANADRSAAAMPIEVIAAESIERAWKRLIRHGRALDRGSTAEALHRVRIDGKRLRYLLEMFRSVYPDAELGPLIASLKKLQDCLGALNDASVEQEALRRLARDLDRESGDSAAALVLIGRLIERVSARGEAARRRLPERFDDLRSKDNRKRIKSLAV